jgi:hypothetical protein
MPVSRPLGISLAAAVLLAGCSFSDDVLWPSLTGGDPAGSPAPAQPAQAGAQRAAPVAAPPAPPPVMSTTTFQPVQIAQGQPTGTFVGQKVTEMRSQLVQLQQSVGTRSTNIQAVRGQAVQASERYHALTAAINSRLQIGTTPGNPVLVGQWNQAQGELDKMNEQIGRMNAEANGVAGDSSVAAFILESARAAYGISGAVDDDHKQLNILEDEVNKVVVSIDRLLNDLAGDVSRQNTYISRERANLTALSVAVKNGELYGQSLANRAFTSGAQVAAAQGATGPRRPLVVIRFDNPNVEYEQALYTAMKGALDRKPDAQFELVAVSPTRGPMGQSALKSAAAKRNADQVMRSLNNMGLPPNRIATSASQSDSAESNEVHIYVR